MTETTPQNSEAPSAPVRSSRGRIVIAVVIVIVVALAAAAGLYLAVHLLPRVLPTPTSAVQTHAATESSNPPTPDVFVSDDEGFSVAMTGTPDIKDSTYMQDGVEYAKVRWIWTVGPLQYFVGVTDLPDSSESNADLLLDAVINLEVAAPGNNVKESGQATISGEPAAVGIWDTSSLPTPVRFVILIHNKRQYMLFAPVAEDSSDEDFLSSFTLID